jgi:hypothetical protein
MISKQFRCVFVHIPRTAGTSIENALGWIGNDVIGPGGTLPYESQDHRLIGELRTALPPEDFAAYFKFTFVRNPWDRAASWYKALMQDPYQLENFKLPADCSFRQFLLERPIWGLEPQLDWIREADGGIPLDFIGRFERLQEDFAKVRHRLGPGIPDLPDLTKAWDRTRYTAFYDAELRWLVAKRYAEEIDLFGYRFGD